MSRRSASSILSVAVLLASTIGAVVVLAGSAGATPVGCNVFVAGENVGDTALQAAINGAHAGATVCVGAGTYPEQITIATANLHLVGAPGGATIIAPTSGVANAVDYDSGSNMPLVAVVVVANVSGVVLKHLTVNAAGAASSIAGCSPGLVGVDFQNVSSGKLTDSVVENAMLSPSLLGCQSQTGVYAYTGYFETGYTPAHATVTVTGTTVSAYGKGGIVCDDPGLTCVVKTDHIVGIGETPAIAANGIQVAYGAVGTIAGDHVSGNAFDGATATNDFYGSGWSSAGILLYEAGAGTRVSNSKVSNNQMGIVGYEDVSDLINGNTVTNSVAYGIAEYGTPSTIVHIQHNSVGNPTTQSIGIFVANGTFYLTSNHVTWAQSTGDQGASQAVTGPGTVYPSAPAQNISTAAIQAVSDGGPTLVYSAGNVYLHDSARTASLAVFGGTVTVRV
ncbi:MAG TPA: right-handed parallel beta-helix repeat-containing protein [Thermoplasmata archaeon]|nr:right-handed parallel beta-helix repeat-containing protein [Thermoplasmata archaeon]